MIVISYRHWGRPSVVNIRSALFFVRSGSVYLPNTAGTFGYAGHSADYWSSRGSSTRYDGVTTPSAYNLNFNATGVNPSNGPNNRYNGFPLRCLLFSAAGCRSFAEKSRAIIIVRLRLFSQEMKDKKQPHGCEA